MYYIFHNLIKRNYKASVAFFVFHILFGLLLFCLFKFASISINNQFLAKSSYLSLVFIYMPSTLICIYGLIFYRYKDSWKLDSDLPPAMHPDNLISFWTAVLISLTFLFTLVYLYLSGFEGLKSSLLHPFGFLNWGIFSLQSRIIIANYLDSKNWFNRLKDWKTREWLIVIDLVFILLMIFVIIFDLEVLARVVMFIYGFRLMRILLLVPYFEQVWKSISRGIRLTANYVTSFLVILLVFSMNSRMLFSSEGTAFKSLPSSIYSNFQIILGNGFEMAGESSLMQLYVFAVTLIIGIIFTSTITALITDSLLAKNADKGQEESGVLPWYKKGKDEIRVFYVFRLCAYLSKI